MLLSILLHSGWKDSAIKLFFFFFFFKRNHLNSQVLKWFYRFSVKQVLRCENVNDHTDKQRGEKKNLLCCGFRALETNVWSSNNPQYLQCMKLNPARLLHASAIYVSIQRLGVYHIENKNRFSSYTSVSHIVGQNTFRI